MPLYDFVCISCEHKFEDLIKINDSNPNCPECNSETKKLVSIFSGKVEGSEHRSIDCIVGADAEKRWQKIEQRKALRKSGVDNRRKTTE